MEKTDKKKKILFVVPSFDGGGAERVLLNILRSFNYMEYLVKVCVGLNIGVYREELPPNVKLIVLFPNRLVEKIAIIFHRYFNNRTIPYLLLKFKIHDNFDTGISFIDGYYTDFMLTLTSRIRKKISWVHASYSSYTNYSKYYKGGYKERLIADRYNKLDKLVFVSNDSLSEFTKIFGYFGNFEVIYNFMNIESIRQKAEEKTIETLINGSLNIIAVGSLIPVKAYDRLIMVAKKLKNDKFKFKITILGTGDLYKKLVALIKDLELQDYVELPGFITNPYPLIKASDIFVMTSKSEALPTALCEAMILGLPCVVTDCSGCREISGNGEFAMMTGQSVDEIYEGLKALISDAGLRSEYKHKSLQRSLIFNDKKTMERIYSVI